MRTRKRLAGVVAIAGVSLLVAAACSSGKSSDNGKTVSTSFADCDTKPNACNGGKTKAGGTLTYTIEKTITGWNLNDTDSNTFDFAEVLDGVLPNVFNVNPDFSVVLNTDMMVSAEQTSTSPQTVTYKIKPDATWDDGTPISADDFVYAWQTQNGNDCKDCAAASTAGYDQMKSVTGSDNGKTVTVVYNTPYTDWKQPFGGLYPAHVAKQHGDLAASWKWFNENQPTYSGGPYKITEFQKDVSVTEVANPKWYGKTKPSLDKLVFRIITDQNQEVPALQNNEVQAIYPQPNADMVNQVKGIQSVQYTLGKGLTWEHFDLNLKNKFLGDKALRQAIFQTVNRQSIIDKTIGQFVTGAKPLNSHNFVPGQNGYKDVITATNQGNGDLEGAKKLLTDAGYKDVGTALKTPSGETGLAADQLHHRKQAAPADLRAVPGRHGQARRQGGHRADPVAGQDARIRRLRRDHLRLGQRPVPLPGRPPAVEQHQREQLRQVGQPAERRAAQAGGQRDRPAEGPGCAQPGRPGHGERRLRASAVPEADVPRRVLAVREHPRQPDQRRPAVQRPGVGPARLRPVTGAR